MFFFKFLFLNKEGDLLVVFSNTMSNIIALGLVYAHHLWTEHLAMLQQRNGEKLQLFQPNWTGEEKLLCQIGMKRTYLFVTIMVHE